MRPDAAEQSIEKHLLVAGRPHKDSGVFRTLRCLQHRVAGAKNNFGRLVRVKLTIIQHHNFNRVFVCEDMGELFNKICRQLIPITDEQKGRLPDFFQCHLAGSSPGLLFLKRVFPVGIYF